MHTKRAVDNINTIYAKIDRNAAVFIGAVQIRMCNGGCMLLIFEDVVMLEDLKLAGHTPEFIAIYSIA